MTKAMLLLWLLAACSVMTMHAQKSDGFFRNEELYNNRDGVDITGSGFIIGGGIEEPVLPNGGNTWGFGLGNGSEENPTPLGSGIIVLMATGTAYVLRKKLKINR